MSAKNVAEAASLIWRAARLLDECSPSVIAKIEKVAGTEHINGHLASDLEALAEWLGA